MLAASDRWGWAKSASEGRYVNQLGTQHSPVIGSLQVPADARKLHLLRFASGVDDLLHLEWLKGPIQARSPQSLDCPTTGRNTRDWQARDQTLPKLQVVRWSSVTWPKRDELKIILHSLSSRLRTHGRLSVF